MRTFALCLVIATVLAGCSGGDNEYEMTVDQARSKLLGASFERGILPGSSGLKPRVQESSAEDGSLEWQVLDDSENGSGWWCPLTVEPSGDDAKKVRVVNKCDGMLGAKNNKDLDELVDATLTGRSPKFDK